MPSRECLQRVGGWGNLVSPSPGARAAPAHTLPPGEERGKPGFPLSLLEGQALPPAGV